MNIRGIANVFEMSLFLMAAKEMLMQRGQAVSVYRRALTEGGLMGEGNGCDLDTV